jgi:hypothetical protein
MKRTIKIAPRYLPVGSYQFKVLEVSGETDSKKGHDLLKVKLAAVNLEDGRKGIARDGFPIIEEMYWKIGSFLLALGYAKKEDNTIDYDDSEMVGRCGYLLCEETEGNSGKKYTNYRYLLPDDERLEDFTETDLLPDLVTTAAAAPVLTPEVVETTPEPPATMTHLQRLLAERKVDYVSRE